MKIVTKSLIKELKKQKSKDKFLLFLDTPIIVEEALNNGFVPLYILVDKKQSFDFLSKFENSVFVAESNDLNMLSDTKTNAGIIGIFSYKNRKFNKIDSNYLVLDSLQDAGNVGTLLRTALACDFRTVVLIDCVHLTNPKVIRSSAGALFKLNLLECSFEKFKSLNLNNLVYADMKGEIIDKFAYEGQFGLVLGNEGNGVTDHMKNLCMGSIALPMKNNLESLNVAVCGGIIMYYQSYLKK